MDTPRSRPIAVLWRADVGRSLEPIVCQHQRVVLSVWAYGTVWGGGGAEKNFAYLKWASHFWLSPQNLFFPRAKFCLFWVGGLAWGGSDVLGRPYTVGAGGVAPPPPPLDAPPLPLRPPPLLPFQCLRLTAKILLRRLRCQEDLSFSPPSAGTIGGPSEEGVPAKPPPPPFTFSNTSLLAWGGGPPDHPPPPCG